MEIFTGIGYCHSYSVPRRLNDEKIVVDAFNRFSSRIVNQIKNQFTMTDFEHSKTKTGSEREAVINSSLSALELYFARFGALARNFLNLMSLRLNPSDPKFIHTSFSFDISIEAGYASDFAGKDVNIQSNNVFWSIPATVFNNYGDWTSAFQEVKLYLAKWVISPIFSNTTETNYFETNVTEVAFLNTAGVNIEMNNLTDEIQTKEPHKKMRSYNETSLKCKSWDNSLRIFKSDG